MTTYELETGTLMFIPVPEDSHSFRFIETKEGKKNQLHYTILTNEVFYTTNQRAELIEEDFKPLSLFSKLKEEDVKEVMPTKRNGRSVLYEDFNKSSLDHCAYALQSIHSLAQHLGLNSVNPYGEKRECKGWCLKCDRWQQAQSKVKQYFVVFKAKQ